MLKTLDRGLHALRTIGQHVDGLLTAELAKELDVDRAIAYRIVSTLEQHRMVVRQPDGRLVLGSAALDLGNRFLPQFRRLAAPVLERLTALTDAAAFISIAEGRFCTAILVSEPTKALFTVSYRVGSSHPIDQGAAGIAILAGRPATDDDAPEVREARTKGYALTTGALQKGAIGVASPILPVGRTGAGLEACVGVVAMEDLDTERAIREVTAAAIEIARLVST